MTTSSIATSGGGTNYPNNYYKLGVPAPASAPTITHGSPGSANNIQSRAYIYTYVSAYGEEGPPSDPSELHDITDGDSVTVGVPGTGPDGAYNITKKNIYRLNSGIYQFVAQINLATTTYADTTLNAALGDEIESTEYDPPPSDLKGLFKMANGCLGGFTPTEFCMSEPYLPHAWPVRYRIPFAGGIVSAGAFGNSVLVTNGADKPYLLTGADPGSMLREQFELGHACMSKRGTVDMGDAVVFPTPFGLVVAGTGKTGLMTKDVVDPMDFASTFAPSTLLGAKHGDNYIGFHTVNGTNKGFVFNARTGDLSTIDTFATATYTDPGTGDLYLVVNGDIVKFDGSATEMEADWESKTFILGRATNFSRAQVRAESYPVTFEVYADGRLVSSRLVTSKTPFTLPGKFLSDEWRYRILSKNSVRTVAIANSVSEL
jgi:hypothetical protein